MKLYSFDIPNSSYEMEFDSEEYERDPDNNRFCGTGPFVYWEEHRKTLARVSELEQRINELEQEKIDAYSEGYSDGLEG
jgi:hypothetical protein